MFVGVGCGGDFSEIKFLVSLLVSLLICYFCFQTSVKMKLLCIQVIQDMLNKAIDVSCFHL